MNDVKTNTVKISKDDFIADMKKCKKDCANATCLGCILGVAFFCVGFYYFDSTAYVPKYEWLAYGGLVAGMIFIFFGFIMTIREIGFQVSLKSGEVLACKWKNANESGQMPSAALKKWRLYALIAAVIMVVIYGCIFMIVNNDSPNDTAGCGHESCAENGPFPCYGKNNTCTNTTNCYQDLYCDKCDKSN